MLPRREQAPWPAAPGNNATIVLFCTHPRAPGGSGTPTKASLPFIDRQIDCITITWHLNDQASAANGIRVYTTKDGGVTWRETDLKDDGNAATIGSAAPVQVPILAAGQEWRETFVVSHLRGVAIEYTAGGTGPTAVTGWDGDIAIDQGQQSVAR